MFSTLFDLGLGTAACFLMSKVIDFGKRRKLSKADIRTQIFWKLLLLSTGTGKALCRERERDRSTGVLERDCSLHRARSTHSDALGKKPPNACASCAWH